MDDVLSAFVNKVVTHASELRCIPKDVLYKHWVKRLSVSLQKGLCMALVRKVFAATNKGHGGMSHQNAISVVDMEMVHVNNIRF